MPNISTCTVYTLAAFSSGSTSSSVLEKLQVMAEQRKMLTQSIRRKRTPNTTQSHSSQLGPSSQSPVLAGDREL